MKSDLEIVQERIGDRLWRLNNLYYIQNKQGEKQLFCLNWAQKQLYDDIHYRNVILKARQLGITTFITLLFLDTALFNSDTQCGIISDTEENAKYIFRKIKYAYDCLPGPLKDIRGARIDSAKELTFSNNSLIRVGTSLRSATFQCLLVSEFGKIASVDLKRTDEILSGSLNTIGKEAFCFIESTARGAQGAFFDLCVEAKKMQDSGKTLTPLDYRFHFMSWHRHPEYFLEPNEFTAIPEDLIKYFKDLKELHGIKLTPPQMNWYSALYKVQQENMFREYPSVVEEAFQANTDGHYYAKYITKARKEKRICAVPYDSLLPCYIALDLGISKGNETAIWWFQQHGSQIRLIDYYENSGEPLKHYLDIIKNKPYRPEKIFVPHDASSRELGTGLTRIEVASNHGINFEILPKIDVQEGIDGCKGKLDCCWFDEIKCEKGIKALEGYRREWNETLGVWRDKPRHDHFSNGSDAFRYLCMSLENARPGMTKEQYQKLKARNTPQTSGYNNRLQPPNFPGRGF